MATIQSPGTTSATETAQHDPAYVYRQLLDKYEAKAATLKTQLGWLSLIRLLTFVGFIYLIYRSVSSGGAFFVISTLVTFIGFLLLIRLYDRWQQETAFYKALVKLNRNEIDFLGGEASVYPDGREYVDPHHAYSYDLDLFGEAGLFAYINRCSSAFGKEALSQSLLHANTALINERQEAIVELKDRLEFRQHLQAHGSLLDAKEKEMDHLRAWLKKPASFDNRPFYYFLFLFPVAGISCLIYYFISEQDRALNLFYFFFVLNIIIAGSFTRIITAQLSVSTSVTKILQQFAGQLRQIETQTFQSPLLRRWQSDLRKENVPAFVSIAKLASLFNYLETIVNLVVSMLLNGFFLFHVHILFALEKWKKENASDVIPWLERLGEVEALNSFANLAFNNRAFCQPQVSAEETLVAVGMGHPLIRSGKRINNSISFAAEKFVILTGSNMSGKSTFLRTVGINLVLARAGSMVCAEEFIFYPYEVHVSMRISDSLQDSESFFYAELKRLHAIISDLQQGEKTFVILDEILRGTNSDDKHHGTVGLIHKMVNAHACGIIATHDLTVSKLRESYPHYISNKCFESAIINDELLFDYKLKEGVCTKLSASFLMKKMGIIE